MCEGPGVNETFSTVCMGGAEAEGGFADLRFLLSGALGFCFEGLG